jgi:hypothetical protein
MAANKSTKKYFDVAPPTAPLVRPKNRKIIGTPTVGVNVVDEETLAPDITKPTSEEKESIVTPPTDKKLETLDDLAKAFEERHKPKKDIEADQPEPEKEEINEPNPNEVGVNPLPPDTSEPEEDFSVSEDQEDVESDENEDETLDDIGYKQEENDDEVKSSEDDKIEPVDNEVEADLKENPKNKKDLPTEDVEQTSEPEGSEEEKAEPSIEIPDTPDTPAPSSERFSVTDGLPDPGEKATKEAKENMQSPTIYDTKEYHVPIGKSHHAHGGVKGAFIFGIVCALAVVASIVAFMLLTDR